MNDQIGLFETLRVVCGEVEFLDRHAERMAKSTRALGLTFDKAGFTHAVLRAAQDCTGRRAWRLRIDRLPGEALHWRTAIAPLGPRPWTVSLCLARDRVDGDDPLCRHKRAARGVYARAQQWAESMGHWDAILLNQTGQVAETGRANLYAWDGARLRTPPLSAGVLPGIVRQVLLDAGQAKVGLLGVDDLRRASAVLASNSLVGIVGVSQIQGLAVHPDPGLLKPLVARLREACHPQWTVDEAEPDATR